MKSSPRWYGIGDIRHNLGQFIPNPIAHPLNYFNPNEIKELQRRMTNTEYDIDYLKKRSDIDKKAFSKLEAMLPDFVVCKKNKYGNLQIPDDFWHALQDKIRSDNSLFQQEVVKVGGKTSNSGVSTKDIERIAEKSATRLWDKFLSINKAKVSSWSDDEFDSRFSLALRDSFKNDILVSKEEFLELIRQSWEDTQNEVKSEVGKLAKQLDRITYQIGKVDQQAVGTTKDELKIIAADVIKKLLPGAQLEALSKANLKISVNHGLLRVNFFSPGTGAVVNPYITSPNYVFPSMNQGMFKNFLSWIFLRPAPKPNPPEAALTRWEEHGDCWCSPSKDADGFGPSIGVMLGSSIYPDQVVVEHISPTAALEPGAAPREMELLAYIDDESTYNSVKAMSQDIFTDEADESQHQYPYIRVATWRYDAESDQNVQAFPVQVDLKSFGPLAHTNRLIVRAKNNWGGDAVAYTCLYRVRLHGEAV